MRSVRQVDAIGPGLIYAGVGAGDRVCLLADTRPDWSYAGLAVLAAGGDPGADLPTSSAEECAWIVGDSGASLVICENATQLAKVEPISADDRSASDRRRVAGPAAPSRHVVAGQAARTPAAGPPPRDQARRPQPDHLHVGHHRPAQGLRAHPRQLARPVHASSRTSPRTSTTTSSTCSCPLAHVFAQIVQFGCLYAGGTLAYFGGDVRAIVPELAQVKPTFLPSVPRIFEKVYTLVTGAVPPEQRRAGVRLGLEVRRAASVPASRCRRAGGGVRGGGPAFRQGARGVRRAVEAGAHRRRADLPGGAGVLPRRRRPGAGGLRHDRDHRGRHGHHAGQVPARYGRTAGARRLGPDRGRTARSS